MTDLVGQKYGKLTVIELDRVKSTTKRKYWLCKCECGNIKSIRSDSLGKTQSCGCLTKQQAKQNIQKALATRKEYNNNNNNTDKTIKFNPLATDLTGKIFGNLTVIKRLPSDKQGVKWLCKCNCGNTKIAYSYNLIHGKTRSCGCIKSFKEKEIKEFLIKSNIFYKREYCFSDLKDKMHLRFDFAIIDDNKIIGLIEYNGEQHYNKTSGWYNEDIAKHDKMKIIFCQANHYPLLILNKDNYNQQLITEWINSIK